jgi:NADPH2:quinone reductase
MATKTRRTPAGAGAKKRKAPARTARRRATTTESSFPVPSTMKAAAIDKFGPPDVLTVHTLPIPKVGPKEVLIAVRAAGVAGWDAKMRTGEYAEGKEKFPLVLGSDGAGIVAKVGKAVRRLKPLEEVWAYQYNNKKGGFNAEYVVVNADSVERIPKELTMLEAGAAAATGITALQGIEHLRLRAKETVLVFGATGAVGSLAVQFAKQTGAHVIATASTADGEKAMHDVGIEDVLDSRAADASARLKSFAPNGLNAMLAFAGGDALERCIDQVVEGGRVAYPNGVEPEPRKRPKVRLIAYDGETGRGAFQRLNRAVADSHLRVLIADKFPLEEAGKAHARVEESHVIGRVALQIA